MRNFVYASDAKIDMLFPQTRQKEQKFITAEISFDLKLLKGNIKSERKTVEGDSYNKLLAVEKHIHKQYKVGSVTHPESWIQGKGIAMPINLLDDKRAMFYFMRQEGTYLALGGSIDHVIGRKPDRKERIGYSYAPDLIHSLLMLDRASKLFLNTDDFLSDWLNLGVAGEKHPWGHIIYDMCHSRQDRSFKTIVSFLAKTLDITSHDGHPTILATPLFIETVDL